MEREISAASERLRTRMQAALTGFEVLTIDTAAESLAKAYLKQAIFPRMYQDDALHVAVAVVAGIDYLVSWNFKHLVKVNTRRAVNHVNELNHHPRIEIIAPPEL